MTFTASGDTLVPINEGDVRSLLAGAQVAEVPALLQRRFQFAAAPEITLQNNWLNRMPLVPMRIRVRIVQDAGEALLPRHDDLVGAGCRRPPHRSGGRQRGSRSGPSPGYPGTARPSALILQQSPSKRNRSAPNVCWWACLSIWTAVKARGKRVRNFVHRLGQHLDLPITMWDERLTSFEADLIMARPARREEAFTTTPSPPPSYSNLSSTKRELATQTWRVS